MADELFRLVGRDRSSINVALLPNAKDYYASRAQNYKIREIVRYQNELGLFNIDVVDLRNYRDSAFLYKKLREYDLVWAVGGNTFCLRQEMKRSGFDEVIRELLSNGVVYGGDSAGAVVAGTSLRGIESVDIPEFTEEVIQSGLELVPHVLLPHADNDYFADTSNETRRVNQGQDIIQINDNQAVIFEGESMRRVTADISANT